MAVYPRGKKRTYWMRFRFCGQWVHESCHTPSKTLAKDIERKRRQQLSESFGGITKRELPSLFEKAATVWLESVKVHLAERTVAIYGDALRLHLRPAFGSILLCDITAQRISEYQTQRRAEGASARTLNKELQVLRMILKRYKMWANLQGDVRFEREPKGIGKALTAEQETALLQACAQSDSACYTAVTLALNTTMRSSEIKTLRWEQVDLFEQVLTVGKSKTEAGTGRVIPLNAAAVKALAGWAERFPNRQQDHFVFPFFEGVFNPAAVNPSRHTKGWRTAWRNALKRAGLKLRFHDLRHTAITKLAEGQASDQTIMSIAGHVSRQMLEHYSHIRIAAKRSALDAISTTPPEARIPYPNETEVPVQAGKVQ